MLSRDYCILSVQALLGSMRRNARTDKPRVWQRRAANCCPCRGLMRAKSPAANLNPTATVILAMCLSRSLSMRFPRGSLHALPGCCLSAYLLLYCVHGRLTARYLGVHASKRHMDAPFGLPIGFCTRAKKWHVPQGSRGIPGLDTCKI